MTSAAVHPKTLKDARQARWLAGAVFLIASIMLLLLSVLPLILDTARPNEAQVAGWLAWLALLVGAHNAETRYQALKRASEGADEERAAAAGSATIG